MKRTVLITVDLHDAQSEVDLGTSHGRCRMIEQADTLAPGGLHAVLAVAGIAGVNRAGCVASINYFGGVATLEGLLPLKIRRRGARAVAIASAAGMQLGNEVIVDGLPARR